MNSGTSRHPRNHRPAKGKAAGVSILTLLAAMLFLVPGACHAITFKEAPGTVEKLEQKYEAVRAELDELLARREQVLRDGASLKERGDYVRRIFSLRRQLEALSEQREALVRGLERLPQAPPVLKLVEITREAGSEAEGNGAGFVLRNLLEVTVGWDETGLVEETLSFRILHAPLEIRPDKPFHIEAELTGRRRYPDNHVCLTSKSDEKPIHLQVSAKGFGQIGASARGEGLASYCGEGNLKWLEKETAQGHTFATQPRKGATVTGAMVKLQVNFKPTEKRIAESMQQYYYDATVSGQGETSLASDRYVEFFKFDLPTDEAGYVRDDADLLGGTGINGIEVFMGAAGVGGIFLHYEPVRRNDPFMSALNVPPHPEDALKPLKEGAVTQLHTMPEVTGLPVEEAIALLEDRFLGYDLQPGSPAPGTEEDGTVESQSLAPGEPMQEGDTVVLKVFSPYVDTRTIPVVRGSSPHKAFELLKAAGFEDLVLRPGSPASTPEESEVVEKTLPPADTQVDIETHIEVYVHSPYVDQRTVPDLRGLTKARVRETLSGLGLDYFFNHNGSLAQNDHHAGTVEAQKPPPNTVVAAGSKVELTLFRQSRHQQLSQHECAIANSHAAWDEERNVPTCRCDSGYRPNEARNACVMSRDAQLARHQCNVANSHVEWDAARNAPTCRCDSGFKARGNACIRVAAGPPECGMGDVWLIGENRCVPASWCNQNIRGSIAEFDYNTGRGYKCKCPVNELLGQDPQNPGRRACLSRY